MYTSVMLVTLTSLLVHGELVPERPAWLNDYSLAAQRALAHQKPLAVFIGSGQSGWDDLSKERALGKQVKEILSREYVCVYLDTTRDEARSLAKAFAITSGAGLILSDRSGKVQAFRHEGDLESTELPNYLNRYADPS